MKIIEGTRIRDELKIEIITIILITLSRYVSEALENISEALEYIQGYIKGYSGARVSPVAFREVRNRSPITKDVFLRGHLMSSYRDNPGSIQRYSALKMARDVTYCLIE